MTNGTPMALLVASSKIKIPIVPMINSIGTLNPKNSVCSNMPPRFTSWS